MLVFVVGACAGGAVLLPLLVTPSLAYPDVTGKAIGFQFLAQVAVAAWLVLLALDRRFAPRSGAMTWAVVAFMVVTGVANLLGVDPYRSFWGTLERADGYVFLVHLCGFFLATSSVLTSRRTWERVLLLSATVSAVVTARGFLELAYENAIGTPEHRVSSTLGNPAYLAAYLLIHVFLIAYLFADRPDRPARRILLGCTLVLEATLLTFTATRGAIVGLAAGAAVAILLAAIRSDGAQQFRRRGLAAATALVLLVTGFLGYNVVALRSSAGIVPLDPRGVAAPSGDPASIVLPEQRSSLAHLADFGSASVGYRLRLWRMAIEGVRERPVLGWGQQNFEVVVARHPDPLLGLGNSYDREHSSILQWLVAAGPAGLLTYLAMFGVAAAALYRAARPELRWPAALIVGLVAAHVTSGLVLFDVTVTYLLCFLLFAFAAAPAQRADRGQPLAPLPALLAVTAALVVTLAGLATDRWMLESARTLAATEATAPGDTLVKVTALEDLLDGTPYDPWQARRSLARNVVRLTKADSAPGAARPYVDRAVAELLRQIEVGPPVTDPHAELAWLLIEAGLHGEARDALRRAVAAYPSDPTLLLMSATAEDHLGNREAAFVLAGEALELDPQSPQPRLAFSALAWRTGRAELALDLLAPRSDDRFPSMRVAVAVVAASAANDGSDEDSRWRAAVVDWLARRGGLSASTVLQLSRLVPSLGPGARELLRDVGNADSLIRTMQRDASLAASD